MQGYYTVGLGMLVAALRDQICHDYADDETIDCAIRLLESG